MAGLRLKKYNVYLDDGTSCYREAIPARDEQGAKDYVKGNGEIIAVKEITEDFPISAEKVARALFLAGFGQTEIDLITRTLQITCIAD